MESHITWKEYPIFKPQAPGYYLAINDGVVGIAFYSFGAIEWTTFISTTDEVKPSNITHWAYFPDAK